MIRPTLEALSFWTGEAEQARQISHFSAAVAIADALAAIPVRELESRSSPEMSQLMQLWRIKTVSLLSLSQQPSTGKQAVSRLQQTDKHIKTYYDHPYTQSLATSITESDIGGINQIGPEMTRDKGKLAIYQYSLTHNPGLLSVAISFFDQAIAHSLPSSSTHGVAVMERELVRKQQGTPIDFTQFYMAYDSAVTRSHNAHNWDRMATISYWSARESLLARNWGEFDTAVTNLFVATNKNHQNPLLFPAKDLARHILNLSKHLSMGKIYL